MHHIRSTRVGNGAAGRLMFSVFGLAFAFFGTLFVKQEWKNLQESKAMQVWQNTTCVITSSEVADHGEDFRLKISYRYTVNGITHNGHRYGRQEHLTAESIGKIEQAHRQYPVDREVSVYYNPDNPSMSVLDPPSLKEAYRSVGFTLIFPAFGLLFAMLPWLGGNKTPRSERQAARNEEHSPKMSLIIFGALIALVGFSIMYPLLIKPLQKTRDAQHWDSVQATVVSSKVKSHDSDDGTTYSVYIAYRYTLNGAAYFGDQYTFMGGSSSGYRSKAEIVRRYPKGYQFNVFVNPFDPSESVIQRDYSLSLLFGLIPLVFAIVGVALMIVGMRNRKPKLDMAQSKECIVALKGASPVGKACGLILFTTFWFGIVYFLAISDAPLMFPVIFGFFGLILVGASIHSALAIFNPRPTVEITPGKVHPGTSVAMRWRTYGRTDRIDSFTIKLQCLKITTETRSSGGKSTTTVVKKPLHESELLNTSNQAEIAQGTLQFSVPRDLPASRPGNYSGIRWQLEFYGIISRWPDMKEELPFLVYPVEAFSQR